MALHPVPQFESPEDWKAWFEAELSAALPPGWRREVIPASLRGKTGWIVEPAPDPASCLNHDFIIEPAADWSVIIVYCGNSDAGAGGIHWYAEQARVIQRDSLAFHPLREMLQWVFRRCEPNVRGLT